MTVAILGTAGLEGVEWSARDVAVAGAAAMAASSLWLAVALRRRVLRPLARVDAALRRGGLAPDPERFDAAACELQQLVHGLQQSLTDREDAGRQRQALLDSVHDGLLILDAERRITAANRAVERIFGHAAADLLGRDVAVVWPDAGAPAQSCLAGWFAIGDQSEFGAARQVVGRDRDGAEVPLSVTLGGCELDGARAVTVTLRDLRAELQSRHEIELVARHWREAHEALQIANEEVERTSRAKSTFLANMSHEIRTPMTAILGFADRLLVEDLGPEESREAIETIRRNGHHLLEILNDILDLSKIESGKLRIEQVPCEPARLVRDAVDLLRVRALDKGLELRAEIDGSVPAVVLSDPTRIRQILFNLIGNAVKFTNTGAVVVTLAATSRATGSRDVHLEIRVRDSGIGLTQDQIGRLFQAFEQADSSTTRRFGGSGLGLAICRRLARMLGGDIAVQSRFGHGSEFSVRIAARTVVGQDGVAATVTSLADFDGERERELAARESAPDELPCRILLAEDGPDSQRLIGAILRRHGAEVLVADNGMVAVELVQQAEDAGEPFDVVLMDMQMPVMDGLEATRTLRDRGCPVPILALTANVMATDRERCLHAGCDDFHGKPIVRDRLIAQIRALLERARRGSIELPR
ncbi:MAG: ATP-binding protein [Planctomycetota bacterium]